MLHLHGFSEPPLWETVQANIQPATHLVSFAVYSKLLFPKVVKIMSLNL